MLARYRMRKFKFYTVGAVLFLVGLAPFLFSNGVIPDPIPGVTHQLTSPMLSTTILSAFLCLLGFLVILSGATISANNSNKDSDGVIYSGEDDFKREPDLNGKTYLFFELIVEGEQKGKYSAGLGVTQSSPHRNSVRESEMQDIHESGFDIYAPDPFK